MKWEGQSAVVTGACGFIGSHLVEALAKRGARVRALTLYNAQGSNGWMDRIDPGIAKEVELVAGDIRDSEQMRNLIKPGDVVFHLAALIGIPYSYHAPRSYLETNITGTLNVLEAARTAEAARVLVTSTSEVYGSALRVPIGEDHPLQAQSPYSATKIAAEKIAESFHRSFQAPVTVVRPFNTFGPRQSPRAVIPAILLQLLKGANELRLGDVTTTRDYTFVEDTAEGMIRLAECAAAVGRIVNIGTGVEHSIADLAEMAQKICGRRASIQSDPARLRPQASEVRRLCADSSLLSSLTGWKPPVRIEDGMRRTAEWMKGDIGSYDGERYYV